MAWLERSVELGGPMARHADPARWGSRRGTGWLCVVGLSLLAISGLLRVPRAAPLFPGRLIAKEPMVEWRSPGPGEPGAPNARFEIANPGSSPVRVLTVESGCGCATPKVHPRLVRPGGVAIVEVEANPIEIGEKDVVITLETDSPATPIVPLTLRIIGCRRPPFIVSVTGDLTCQEGYSAEDTREIHVDTIERVASSHTPTLRCDLPFLGFTCRS